MVEYIVSPAARSDLIAQWDFYADEVGDLDLADRFVNCAESTFEMLAATPGIGRARTFRSSKAKNLRSWQVEGFSKHLIFYRPLPRKQGVEIVRVLHGARDLEALFE